MGDFNIKKTINQLQLLIIITVFILIGQMVANGSSFIEGLPGALLISIVAVVSLVLRDLLPRLKFPAFAWATLLGFLLSVPWSPTSEFFLKYTNSVGFLTTTTPILALAGISVGNKIGLLKKMSWKIFIISMVVFMSTYFGSAIIAQIILSMQGKI